MVRDTTTLASTLVFTTLGQYIGMTVYGEGAMAVVCVLSGAAAGFLLGTAIHQVFELRKAARAARR